MAAKAKPKKNYIAVQSARTARTDEWPRGQLIIAGSTILPEDADLVQAYPHFFEPVDATVERATAGPGEKRAVAIPAAEDDDAAE